MFLGMMMMKKMERVVQEGRIAVGKNRSLVLLLVVGAQEVVVRRFVRMQRVILMKSIREIETGEGIMILDGRRVVMLRVLV
jgi:hypothetical protein